MVEYDEAFDDYKNTTKKKTYEDVKFKPKQNTYTPKKKQTQTLPFDIAELSDIFMENILPKDIDPTIRSSSKNIGCYALNEILSSYLKK